MDRLAAADAVPVVTRRTVAGFTNRIKRLFFFREIKIKKSMISDFDQSSSDDSLMDASARHEPTSVDAAYARCDPSFAQIWLDRSGLDITQVARMSCLSVAQVRQLLQGTDASFYSATIKQRAYRRVLALLGAPQPELVGAFQAPAPVAA
jgi:hypothetical protein